MIKKYLTCYGYLIGINILLTICLSIINYFIPKSFTIIKIMIPIISVLISSIILGNNTKEKAYIEGIKFIIPYIILTIIIRLLLHLDFNYKVIIIYIILLITSIIGSMIGINIKKN